LNLHYLFLLHTIRWQLWVAVSFVLAGFLVWARGKPRARLFVPWVCLALWLGAIAWQCTAARWNLYFFNRHLWLKGLIAMASIAVLPLVAGVGSEAIVARRGTARPLAVLLVFVVSLCAVLILGHPVAAVVQGGFHDGWWY
jgi:hypothetical protein